MKYYIGLLKSLLLRRSNISFFFFFLFTNSITLRKKERAKIIAPSVRFKRGVYLYDTPDDGPNDVLPLFSLLLRPGFSKPRPVNRIAARYTSSDDSFSAAFRPVHHLPPPSPLARPPPSSFPTSSSSPSLRPFSCLLTHTHVRQWYVCYITLCTAARWSTYLWPMYTYVRVIPGTYIQGESYRKYFLNLRRF